MANQDFSALLAAAPDAKPSTAPQSSAAPSSQAGMDFSSLLAAAPDAQKSTSSDGLFDALLWQESRGQQLDKNGAPITSKKGAIGIAQVMPGTAPEAAKLAGLPYDDIKYRTDAEYNKSLGRAYFNKQLEEFGDPAKALAAYNAGPGALRRALLTAENSGNPDAWLNFMPEETRKYVPSIMAKAGSGRGPSTVPTTQRGDVYSSSVKEPVPERTWFEAINDTVIEAANAAAGGVKTVSDMISPGNAVSEFIDENIIKEGERKQSAKVQSEKQRLSSEMQNAQGAGDEVMAFLGYMARNPVLTAAQIGGMFVVPAGAAKGGSLLAQTLGGSAATALAAGTGAASLISGAMSGGDAAGNAYELVMKTPDEVLSKSPEVQELLKTMPMAEAKKAVATMAAREASKVPAAIGALLGPLGAERIVAGAGRTGSRAAAALKTGAVDAVTGGFEEGVTQFEGQAAASQYNPEIDAMKGVAGAAAAGTAMEAVPGLAAGALARENAPIPPALQPVAEKALQPNSPLSKAAMAGNAVATAESLVNPPAAPVDPMQRLAELEAIGKGAPAQQVVDDNGNPLTIPGEPGRIFTAEEKAEYDQLKALRDATPGMSQEDQKANEPEPVDQILERVKSIEGLLRTSDGLAKLRQDDAPVNVKQFLDDLAKAKSKSTPAAAREQALNRIEMIAEWMGVDLSAMGAMPQKQATDAAGPPTRAAQVGDMINSAGLSAQDRTAAVEDLATYRNRNLPQATRDAALSRALELVGRNTAPAGTATNGEAAVFGDIPPQEGTPERFEYEAERRENGAYQFRELGFDEEANALLAEADSLREAAASARAGELGVEVSADEIADASSSVVQQTVDQATQGLPRVQIPAEDVSRPIEERTAARRKRKAQLKQLAALGFETVVKRGNDFILVNSKTGQEVRLESAADAQLARAAIKEAIDEKANTAAASPLNDRKEPTEAQIKAGNYKKSDVIEMNGVKVVIENPAGSTRRGVGADGKAWESTMVHHYGEIVGTEGADGDRVDVFIGNRPDSNKVFVIDQVNPDGSFDEHKLVFGATSEADARQTYLANYDKGWTGLGAIKEIPVGDLKGWLKTGAKKPAAESGAGTVTVNSGGKTVTLPTVDLENLSKSSARGERGEKITRDQGMVLKGLATFFGKDVVFFKDPDGQIGDGFVKPGDDVTIYLNEESSIGALSVLGHELTHLLKRDNPAAYEAIKKVVQARVKDAKGFRADYNGTKPEETADGALNEAELEELVSDLNGNLMRDPTFWKEVFDQIQKDNGKEAKGIIASLAAIFQRMLDGAIAMFKGQPQFRADRFVTDMQAIREAFKNGMAQYAAGQGLSKGALQAEVLRASNSLGDIKKSPARPDDGLTIEGYHFSKAPRSLLTTGFFGSGLQGSDREAIMAHPDRRLRERLSFYANKGTGVRPEAGVGGIAHKATLTNIYDSDADMKRLKEGRDRRGFESAVINAGYSGYLSRLEGSQPAQVILLGRQSVEPEVLGLRTQIDDAKMVPVAKQRPMNLGDKIAANKSLPAGKMKPEVWGRVLMATMPTEAAQLLDLGVLTGDKDIYKDELVALVRKATPEIKRSAARARDEYAEVKAKYKGTDQWLKAPNGESTNLNERQWIQVRTPSFKAWFGDWEEAFKSGGVWSVEPGTVSTAVGENGEPLVVYHGTDNGGFMEFDKPRGTGRGDLGIFTMPNESMAYSYVRKGRAKPIEAPDVPTSQSDLEDAGYRFDSYMGRLSSKQAEEQELFSYVDLNGNEVDNFTSMEDAVADAIENFDSGDGEKQSGVYALFVNIRNPNESHFEGALWSGERPEQYQVRDESDEPIYDEDGRGFFDLETAERLAEENEGAEVQPADEHYETTDDVVREARRLGKDGAIIREVIDDGSGSGYDMMPSDVFVAFDPAQLKSADFNNGEFSDSTGDIRKSTVRKVPKREHELEMSTRSPSAVAKKNFTPEDSRANLLISDFASGAGQERWINTVAELVTQYPNYREAPTATTPEKKLERLVRQMTDNLIWLHNQIPAEIRDRSKLWYDGANAIANQMKSEYGISEAQSAGILAVLSPQKDWFMNVSLAKRVAGVMAQLDTVEWDAGMTATAARIFGKAQYKQDVEAIRGKPLRAISDDYLRGMWIRTYDETNNSRDFQIVSPEGDDVGVATSKTGSPAKVAWGGIGTIAKAATIFRDGTFDTVDAQLGRKHKVRNFYNNILVPKSRNGHVTIDTHAVAAALLRPLSGNSIEVMHNFGGPKANAVGLEGTYALYEEAYRRAADELGLLPRELQSITWEAIRGMYRPGFKSQSKNVDAVDKIWTAYKKGRLSYEKAREQSVELAGGIDEPSWFGPDAGAYVEDESAAEPGDLAGDGVSGEGDAQPEAGGAGGRARATAQGGQAEAEAAGRSEARAVQDAGGVRRSPGRVSLEGGQDQGAGREEDGSLSGLPRDFKVAGIEIRASHWAPAEEVARRYMEQAGLEYRPPAKYAKVDPERANRIADAYDQLKHEPQNPVVKAAYKALARETAAQYKAVVDSGLKVEFIDFASQGDPYAASPRLMTEDVRDNNHMWVFSTRDGFGTDAAFDPEDNPLLAETDFIISGKRALVNDLFRVVHDYFGHVKEGVGFRADGEENTWRAHSAMFSPLAQRALTTETRGQNSWVNYGPHGEKNRKASAGETHYADQKTGLMPLWVSEEGRGDEVKLSPKRDEDDVTITIGDEPARKPVVETMKDEVQASDAKGRKVSYDVTVEDTGETARMTVDAGEAIDDYDDRIDTMKKLLECLNK